MFYITKIKYDKTMEDGLIKSISEQYIVNALTPGEAEATIIEEMTPFMSGEFLVESITKKNVAEILPSQDDAASLWISIKIGIITLDEKTEKEKLVAQSFLVEAESIPAAMTAFNRHMASSVCDWRYLTVSETKYLDYFTPASSNQ